MGNSAIERDGQDAIESDLPAAGIEALRGDGQSNAPPQVETGRWALIADLPSRLHRWVIERVRVWLGINAHEIMLQSHIQLIYEMAIQGNETARVLMEAREAATVLEERLDALKEENARLKRRVFFYANHSASLYYSHEKFERILLDEEKQR